MLKANKIIKLSENYISSKKIDKETSLEVYTNPSADEIRKITDASFKKFRVRQIRFVVDNQNKKVFVCDAFLAIHPDVAKKLGVSLNLYNCHDPNIITGEANIIGGKAKAITVYPTNSRIIKDVQKINWSWLNNYITGVPEEIKGYEGQNS